MSSSTDPEDLVDYEMEEAAAVLAEALQDDDEQVIRGIQRFGATNWTVLMTPGQIIGTLIRMHIEGREWVVIDSNSGHRDMHEDEKAFWRYLHNNLTTGIRYLTNMHELELLNVRLPERLQITVEHAAEGNLNDEDKRVRRSLKSEHQDAIDALVDNPSPSKTDTDGVLQLLKNDHENWCAIRLHPNAWDDYLGEMDHQFDERIHTHALGNVFGISVRGEGKTIYRSIRNIVMNHSGETLDLEELREEFTRIGRQDRFDFWVRHEQQLRDPIRLISFDDGLTEVTIDRDRAAYRAWERINERAQERFRGGFRSG